MIKAAIGVRCVSCFVGPPLTFLASPATLNVFHNPVELWWSLSVLENWNKPMFFLYPLVIPIVKLTTPASSVTQVHALDFKDST